jgi:hypothetical protein
MFVLLAFWWVQRGRVMTDTNATRPPLATDTREAQAQRVANYLDTHPASTAKEIDAACDTGCISKVLSDMCDPEYLAYEIKKGRRIVECAKASATRGVKTYTLLSRPKKQPQLF